MAEIKNTFIKSKMNKDLDDRLVPTGEYRDALNIQISRSEGDDVGALETVFGNELYYGEDTYETCIGKFVDQNNKKTYYFVTNYIDTSADKISNFAPINAYCAIVQYDHKTEYKTVLVEGQFLNFAANCPITGVNLIEELLFFTDNRNQPRKINVENARAFPAALPDTQRVPSSIPNPYYTKEDQISVAKYYPYKPISLMNISDVGVGVTPTESTMSNPTQEYYPDGTSLKPDYDENWPGDADYLSDKFIRLSYRFKYDDNEYSLLAPFTQPCFIPKQNGYFLDNKSGAVDDYIDTYRSTVVNFFENNVTQILANIEFETTNPATDLKVQEVEIVYKESNALQAKVIESISIEEVMDNMQANGAKGGNPYVFTYKYISTKPYKNIPEKQITRVFDKVPVRALAQEVSGNRVIYGNFRTVQTPPKNIDYSINYGNKTDLLSVSEKEYPNHTLKQNRNYQVGFVLSDRFGRQSGVVLSANDTASLSGGVYYGGSTIYVPYKPSGGTSALQWPGYALQALVNQPIPSKNEVSRPGYPGIYKDENYGADYVFITDRGSGYTNGISNASVSGGTGTGLTVQINVNGGTVRDAIIITPGSGYTDGDQVTIVGGGNNAILTLTVSEPNLLGWYSYKVVVRQTEQDYYNVYLPSILNGYPSTYVNSSGSLDTSFENGETANIVLFNDNINKVPRDLGEVGPDQKQYRSSVVLYGRVTPNNLSNTPVGQATTSTQFYPTIIGDSVVSISTLADTNYNGTTLGTITSGGNSQYSLEYEEFYQSNTNPLIGRINVSKEIGRENSATGATNPWFTGLGVYETEASESLLDIYWETTSTGTITELNQAILEGGFEGAVRTNGYNFILNEASDPGSNCFPPSGVVNNPIPTPQPFDGIQVISAQGNLMYEGVTWRLNWIKDYTGAYRTEEFELYDTGAAGTALDPLSFNIRTSATANSQNSDALFYYGSNDDIRTFTASVEVTYTNPVTSDVTITNIVLDDLKLDNTMPIAVDNGVCSSPLPGSQTPPNTVNSVVCEVIQPIVDQLVTSADFDGYLYFVNGANCAGDDTLRELSIRQGLGSSPFFPGEDAWDDRFYLKQEEAGKVSLWVKAQSQEPYDVIKKLQVNALDAGSSNGFYSSSLVQVKVVEAPPIEITVFPTPICLPYGLWDGSAGGTFRIKFTLDNLREAFNYELDLSFDSNIQYPNSSVVFAPTPCGPAFTPIAGGIYRANITGPPSASQPITYYLDVNFTSVNAAINIHLKMKYNGEEVGTTNTVITFAGVTTIAQQLYNGPNNGQCGIGSSCEL
jgi:hypothetical protein